MRPHPPTYHIPNGLDSHFAGSNFSLALAVVLGLASCGSDDGAASDAVTETNFESKLLTALCDVAPCCSARQLSYESGGCKARWAAAIEQMGEPSAGQAFDSKVAAECLAKVGEVTASCTAPTVALSGACLRVWHDDAQPGEACGGVGDCTSQGRPLLRARLGRRRRGRSARGRALSSR